LPLKIIKPSSSFAPVVWITAAILALAFAFVCARSFFVDTLATRLDIRDPAAGEIVDSLTAAAPSDPKVHLLAGVYYERTFEVADLDRSLAEYQMAAERDPSNYTLWLAVAQAKGRIGDADGARAAFERALSLAPNYADVQWAYGNFLVRQGSTDEGFRLIARAAAADTGLAGPAVSFVTQMSGGDMATTQSLLGHDPGVNSALVNSLIALKRYDDAVHVWSEIPPELRQGAYVQTGQDLMNSLLGDHQFRAAAVIAADLAQDEAAKPTLGQVNNGGFENGVKLRNAGPFEWQITGGVEPQIGLSETQKHGGRYGLTMLFTFRPDSARQISQQLVVEPGGHYRLSAWYKSNLKTDAKYQWQVVDTVGAKMVATTGELSPTDDWREVSADFVVPSNIDGLKLMLVRAGCTSAACPGSGTIAFDDISLTRE
jgi:hypothetical protein